MRITVRRLIVPAAAALGWLVSLVPSTLSQDHPAGEDGLFVAVPSPITSTVVGHVRSQVEQRVNSPTRPVRTVVFDFTPEGKDVANTDFGACYELTKFITEKLRANATTVAFVHAKASGHTVLPILACKELVMSRGASIGEVVTGGATLDKVQLAAYEEAAGDRKAQWAAVRKTFDPKVRLAVGVQKQGGATWYVDRNNPAELATIAGVKDVSFAPVDGVALYTADQARSLELCKATAETRAEVADLYSLSPAVIEGDPLQGRTPAPFRYTLTGEVTGATRETVNRIIRDIKGKKGNVLILTLACGGGDLKAARDLADDLRTARTGDDGLLIVGYVPDQAPDTATFLALGCTDIVMSKRKDVTEDPREAELGGFQDIVKGMRPDMVQAHRDSLKELAEARGVRGIGVLVDGMFDPNLEVVLAHGAKDRTRRLPMAQAEYEAKKAEWVADETIKPRGKLLKLNATLAEKLGVARYTVATRDPEAVYALYGLEPARVREVTPGWLDRFADFLRLPVVTVMLVVIGFTGLILELKVPGLTVPGIIAALCFILVFWSQSRFSGEMFVLAALLFVLGLVLVALEIFVLPGLGAPGIFGVMCMLGGLGLVTFERVPQSGEEWVLLGVKVSQYLFGMIGAFGLAFLIARFLPRVPYANRLLLAPPSEEGEAVELLLPGAGEAASLLGAIGTANTPLRPAGVVRFADKFVDVVSDGGFIPAGTRVQVVAVEGTRIVVKEV